MIKNLVIQNFKSVKDLQMDCKRVNLFIGDANVGKSNIFEAFSILNFHKDISKFIRFHEVSHLFYEYDLSLEITVNAGDWMSKGWIESNQFVIENSIDYESPFKAFYDNKGKFQNNFSNGQTPPKILFYRYSPNVIFTKSDELYLEPPFGENLPSILLANKELQSLVKTLLDDLGFKLLIKPFDDNFEIIRESKGSFLSFPLITMSDTIKRIIYYLAIIKSNENASILLEEPEANTFPFYTKVLAEMIARHDGNQYFIITHNSYLINSIIEKTPILDLNVNLVYSQDYQTKISTLSQSGITDVLDFGSDVFLNFDKLLMAE
ncbi:MAG: AAA family ATPase [Cyclobacteriaceae bacterium]|nr:AAA family ATPase [Cyclobacteriaceae bacterium]